MPDTLLGRLTAPSTNVSGALVGSGPAECTSCTALMPLAGFIWDVNGYYRELGVPTDASRADLRRAYMARNGQSSPRLTYVFKQLLNPGIRAAYDAMPLGEVFDDEYVQAAIRRKVKSDAFDRWADLSEQGHRNLDFDAVERDVMASYGFHFDGEGDGDDTPDEVVDSPPLSSKTDAEPAKFAYSFYLWGVGPPIGSAHEVVRLVRLAEWQRLLIRALSVQGSTVRFAVGLHGREHDWVRALVGYRTVFLLNAHVDPTADMAERAVAEYLVDLREVQQHRAPSASPLAAHRHPREMR